MLKIFTRNPEQKPLSRDYRFYPIYMQVVLRSFGNTIYGLALPNYLIFHEHLSAGLVGIIYSIFTVAYIFGPIIAQPITEKIGLRNALLLAAIAPVISTTFQLLFFIPIVLIVCRTIEGLALGFFWPNVQMQVSIWQKTSPVERSEGFFRIYGFSWNFGCLLGGVFGLLVVYVGQNDFFGLILGWMVLISLIPFAFLTERSEDSLEFKGERAILIINHTGTPVMGARPWTAHEEVPPSSSSVNNTTESKKHAPSYDSTILACFPIAIAVVVQMVHGATRSMYNFTYPLFLYAAGWGSYWSYMILFMQLITQMIGINWSGHLPPRGKYQWFLVGGFACLVISILIIINPNMIFITVLSIILGFFNGLIYSYGAQVMLAHGKVTGSLKYATLYEIFSGIGYGITPLVAGFVADVNLLGNFWIIAAILGIAFVAFTVLTQKTARQKL